jgi:oxygen-independent coproporphyrinogen-3 oxidase
LSSSPESRTNYINYLVNNITSFPSSPAAPHCNNALVDTIFFGGGTPSVLSPNQLNSILTALHSTFTISPSAEISIEVNPKTHADYSALKSIGFNRLSLGLQSDNNAILKHLGRLHTAEDFFAEYNIAQRYFDNINIDLMFGLPHQTLESWQSTLKNIINLNPAHISTYSLIIEPGTPFYNQTLTLPPEDIERNMYYTASQTLAQAGLNRYEISNFSHINKECKHNLKYWTRQDYLGFGSNAHSMVNNVRYQNSSELEYKTSIEEVVTPSERVKEQIMLGLRLSCGVLITPKIQGKYGDALRRQELLGNLKITNSHAILTPRGIDISNVVISEILNFD